MEATTRVSYILRALLVLSGWVGLMLLNSGCAMTDPSRSFTTVVVDAGHGGHDPGARSRHGPPEKVLALDTALRLKRRLQSAGFRVVMTRSTDQFIPLGGRVDIASRYRNAVFVSVHYNWAHRSGADGVEVFYYDPKSKGIAASVQKELIRLPATNRGVKKASYHVLRNSKIPAILVEGGFVSNPTEGKKLGDAAYRERVAQAIANGLIRHRGSGIAGGTTGFVRSSDLPDMPDLDTD